MTRSLLIFLFFSNIISAQITIFRGIILDKETKAPVAYAHVSFKDSDIGVTTSENGEFSIVVEKKYLDSKVLISCLNYKDTLLDAIKLLNKTLYLEPKTEFLQEVIVGKYENKEISTGSIKGKREGFIHKRNVTMIAQFIEGNIRDKSCNYLKRITLTFKENRFWPAKVRIRLFKKDKYSDYPKNDLLSKNLVMTISGKQKIYVLDFSDYDIRIPEDGFFIAIEKLIIPLNMTYSAPIERSTYPLYIAEYISGKPQKNENDIKINSELMSFEKYKSETSFYAPSIDITQKSEKFKHFGNLFLLKSTKWKILSNNYVMPVIVTVSN